VSWSLQIHQKCGKFKIQNDLDFLLFKKVFAVFLINNNFCINQQNLSVWHDFILKISQESDLKMLQFKLKAKMTAKQRALSILLIN
jgi:hypothetical protein